MGHFENVDSEEPMQSPLMLKKTPNDVHFHIWSFRTNGPSLMFSYIVFSISDRLYSLVAKTTRDRKKKREHERDIVTFLIVLFMYLSYDVVSGIYLTPCTKSDKPPAVYRFL